MSQRNDSCNDSEKATSLLETDSSGEGRRPMTSTERVKKWRKENPEKYNRAMRKYRRRRKLRERGVGGGSEKEEVEE